MLRVSDLCMSAGNFLINNITLSVPDGCCHVLLGGTGNGKTLILETIAGLRPIKSGNIMLEESDITNEPPENRSISYVSQDLALFPHLTVEKNIFYSQRFKKNQSRTNEEIMQIIKYLHLEVILHRSIQNLSGGERQRVALARAFATANKVLLLDEPFSALHYTMKRSLWELLSDMLKRYNLPTLLVTHDLEEACFLADYISVLYKGKLLQTDTKDDIFSNPKSIEVTKITGHYNYFTGKVLKKVDNGCLVYIDNLGGEFHTNNTVLKPGDEVLIAIRTSDIDITVSENENLSNPVNMVPCQIKKMNDTSHFQQIVLTPDNQVSGKSDHFIADVYNRNNVRGFKIGQKVIAYFPGSSIFVFNEPI